MHDISEANYVRVADDGVVVEVHLVSSGEKSRQKYLVRMWAVGCV